MAILKKKVKEKQKKKGKKVRGKVKSEKGKRSGKVKGEVLGKGKSMKENEESVERIRQKRQGIATQRPKRDCLVACDI